MFTSPADVLAYIKDEGIEFVDVRFTDLPGMQHHFNVPASSVDEDFFVTGQLFDGSSIRGFAGIAERICAAAMGGASDDRAAVIIWRAAH